MKTKLLRITALMIACLLTVSLACAEGGYDFQITDDGALFVNGYKALYPIDADAQATPYQAENVPIRFQIPAGWTEVETEQDERFSLMAQFVPVKEPDQGMMILVMAGDFMNFVDASDKMVLEITGVKPEEMDNKIFDYIDFADVFGETLGNVAEKTYGEQQYFQLNVYEEQSYGDMTIRINMTSSICLRHGLVYQFITIGNAETNDLYNGYEQLLETVEYTD